MYLLVIAWMYVVLMMSVAEATHSSGTVLGAVITFVLYGLLPVALLVYLMRAPARRKAIKKRQAQENIAGAADTQAASPAPDTSGHATSAPQGTFTAPTANAVAPVREKP